MLYNLQVFKSDKNMNESLWEMTLTTDIKTSLQSCFVSHEFKSEK